MTITNSAAASRFSTDPIASEVSRFLSSRIAMTRSAECESGAVTGFPTSLDRLYPSLYAARPAFAPIAAIRAAVAKIATSLHLPVHGRVH